MADNIKGRAGVREYGELMTAAQAAEVMRVSPRQVARMCARGELKAVRVGKLWRVNRDALAERLGL